MRCVNLQRHWATWLAASLLVAAPAAADEIRYGGLVFETKIIGAEGFSVRYRIRGGTRVKALREIDYLQLSGQDQFNKAEKLLAEEKYAEAVEAYDRASAQALRDWVQALIRWRRLAALRQTERIGRACEQWLAVADEQDASAQALKLRPETLAPKSSDANDRAIELLEGKLPAVENENYRQAIVALLIDLYERQDRTEKAEALIEKTGAEPRDGEEAGPRAEPGASGMEGTLKGAGFLVRQAQSSAERAKALEAETLLRKHLDRFSQDQLAQALLLLGKAQWLAYRQGEQKDRERAVDAGLNFMRVVTYYPYSQGAGEALYLAGRVNEALGNRGAAARAHQAVVENHPQTPWAEKAASALRQLKEQKGEP